MLNRLVLCTAMLLPLSAAVSHAQKPSTAKDTARTASQWLDLGYRGSSVSGDEARWERYRDLRDGVTLRFGAARETEKSALQFSANNVGYNDQRFEFSYNNYGKLKVDASWNQVPLNYAYNARTPWTTTGGNVWKLDAATRTRVQNKEPGVLGIGSTAAHFDQASIYRSLATTFAMQSRRDVASISGKYQVNDMTSVNLAFSSTNKSGDQPYGAAFAFNNGNELPMELDNRTNDVTAAFEWAKPKTGMIRVGWTGSWFKNEFQSLTWDNPLRATDFTNGRLPPLGPYDPSGYSNGNGPAFGRLALPPSNNLSSLSFLGLYKMPGHTTINGQLAFTSMRQDEELIPWTTNSVITSPAVYALFPKLATLPRTTAEAAVDGVNAVLNFTTRPTEHFAFDMRYRFNDHKNKTPHFDAREYVRFDAVPEEIEHGESQQFSIRQNTFETGATLTAIRNSSLRVGYILDDFKRDGRAFSDMTDYTFKVSLDTYGNEYLMVRGMVENTRRVGNGFSEASIEEGGAQPGLRFYDEADMKRTKGTLILQYTPNEYIGADLSLATGKDVYEGEGHEFGLLDNRNNSYNLSLEVYPNSKVTLGGNYGYDKFSSLQKARNANPLSGVAGAYESWLDPNRDWSLDNDETVKNFGLFVDLLEAIPKTKIRFSFDHSDSDNSFVHSGPRIQALLTNAVLTSGDSRPCSTGQTTCFEPLPNVTNSWNQMKLDVTRMFRPKFGVGAGVWYEKFDVTDYATSNLADGSPRIDPLGALTTGYGNRPYKVTTGMVKVIYMF